MSKNRRYDTPMAKAASCCVKGETAQDFVECTVMDLPAYLLSMLHRLVLAEE